MTAADELLQWWCAHYPGTMAAAEPPPLTGLILDHAGLPVPRHQRYLAEETALEWLADTELTRTGEDGVAGTAFVERVTQVLGRDQLPVTVESVRRVDDPAFDAARELLQRAIGPLGGHLLAGVDNVVIADMGAVVGASSVTLPRSILLNRLLLNNRVGLAENLLHEAVHATFYAAYWEATPLRRAAVLGDRETVVCAPWHNPTFSTDDTGSWWRLDRALHAFLVYTHLAAFWSRVRVLEPTTEEAAPALRTSLFAAHYLGSRLRLIGEEAFSRSGVTLLDAMLELVPDLPRLTATLQKLDGRGLRSVQRTGPAPVEAPPGAAPLAHRQDPRSGDNLVVMTDGAFAFRAGDTAVPTVDGVVLRELMRVG